MTTWVEQSSGQKLDCLSYSSVRNLLTYSEQFDNAVWAKPTGVTISPDAALAPDGTTTAELITEKSGSDRHWCGRTITLAANGIYTFSIHIKAASRGYAGFALGKSSTPFTRAGYAINLSTGAITSYVVGTPTYIVRHAAESLDDGWWRVAVTVTPDATSTDWRVEVWPQLTDTGATPSVYTGDGTTPGIYIWGAQLEAGATPSGYVSTTTAARTATVIELDGTVDYGEAVTDSYYIQYLQNDGTLTADLQATFAGSSAVAISETLTYTPEYLFFGWGTGEIETWTDWEAA